MTDSRLFNRHENAAHIKIRHKNATHEGYTQDISLFGVTFISHTDSIAEDDFLEIETDSIYISKKSLYAKVVNKSPVGGSSYRYGCEFCPKQDKQELNPLG